MVNFTQYLSIAYRLWIEKDRVLTKAVICPKKVAAEMRSSPTMGRLRAGK